MTPLLTFLAAGTLLGVIAAYLVREVIEYEKQYKIFMNKKEHQYNKSMTVYALKGVYDYEGFQYTNSMKVFTLQGLYDYEGHHFIGVYSTREKATEAQVIFDIENEGQFDDYRIDESEIDAKAAF